MPGGCASFEDENGKFKRLLAESALDNAILTRRAA